MTAYGTCRQTLRALMRETTLGFTPYSAAMSLKSRASARMMGMSRSVSLESLALLPRVDRFLRTMSFEFSGRVPIRK